MLVLLLDLLGLSLVLQKVKDLVLMLEIELVLMLEVQLVVMLEQKMDVMLEKKLVEWLVILLVLENRNETPARN